MARGSSGERAATAGADAVAGAVAAARGRGTLVVAALLALGFAAALVAPAWLDAHGRGGGWVSRVALSGVCHQLPERTLHGWGQPWAVCARCSGLYLGGAAALALAAGLALVHRQRGFPLLPASRRWLWLVAPTAVDGVLATLGGPSLPLVPRFITALPAGFALGLFLAEAIADVARGGGPSWDWIRSWNGRKELS